MFLCWLNTFRFCDFSFTFCAAKLSCLCFCLKCQRKNFFNPSQQVLLKPREFIFDYSTRKFISIIRLFRVYSSAKSLFCGHIESSNIFSLPFEPFKLQIQSRVTKITIKWIWSTLQPSRNQLTLILLKCLCRWRCCWRCSFPESPGCLWTWCHFGAKVFAGCRRSGTLSKFSSLFRVDFKSMGRHTRGQVFFQVFSLSSTQILFGFFFLWLFFNVRKYFSLFIATNDSPNFFLIFSLSERLKRTRVFYQLASFWSERKVFQYFVRFTFGLVLWSWANILLVWK